jgi:hypothetical protein
MSDTTRRVTVQFDLRDDGGIQNFTTFGPDDLTPERLKSAIGLAYRQAVQMEIGPPQPDAQSPPRLPEAELPNISVEVFTSNPATGGLVVTEYEIDARCQRVLVDPSGDGLGSHRRAVWGFIGQGNSTRQVEGVEVFHQDPCVLIG